MRPGDRQEIPTVAEVVSKASALCDPHGADPAVTAFFESFEDDERPATAPDDLAGELGSTAGGVDPDGASPAVSVVAAAAAWLATNFGHADDRERVLREAVRLGFADQVPPEVSAWLAGQGVQL